MTALTVRAGDCLAVLRELPDASVHAIVTDPPYGLAEHKPSAVVTALTAWASGDRERVPDGRGFMGRAWDSFVPPPAVWDECLRVLTPGGHLLCFAGTRTVDLMGLSIRLAGFEIRDAITWMYGSGFPKSLDVSKAINAHETLGGSSRRMSRRAAMGHAYSEHDKVGSAGTRTSTVTATTTESARLGDDATDAARQWSGWGTALKPASEPIIVARKPLSGTVAATVLEHGTGAINVDACRVQYASDADRAQAAVPQPTFGVKGDGQGTYNYRAGEGRNGERFDPGQGRWPTNVVLSHGPGCGEGFYSDPPICQPGCPVAELDAQSGVRTSGNRKAGNHELMGYMGAGVAPMPEVVGDTGSASRFFPVFKYQAKAPSKERPKVEVDGKDVGWPTVKPLALMQWLIRLVTPPGGVVLDPFAGSGTTAQAAASEGFECVLIERDELALRLIGQRLGSAELAFELVEAPTGSEPEPGPDPVTELQPTFEPVPAPEPEPVDPLLAEIAAADGDPALTALWESHEDIWTDEHTAAVRARLAQLGVAA